MLNYLKIIALLVALALISFNTHSVEIEGLYKASVPLEDQNKPTRQVAFKEALENILVKVTGAENTVTELNLINLFKPYESYVLSYSYIENPEYSVYLEFLESAKQASLNGVDVAQGLDDGGEESEETVVEGIDLVGGREFQQEVKEDSVVTASSISQVKNDFNASLENETIGLNIPESEKPKPYLLNVEFSRPSINSILRRSGQRIWGKSRPSLIAWLISEEQGIRSVLSAYEGEQVLPGMKKNADNRGLHLFFPTADLEDQINTDVNLLWGMFEEGLPQRTGRYNYDVALIVVIDSVTLGSADIRINEDEDYSFQHELVQPQPQDVDRANMNPEDPSAEIDSDAYKSSPLVTLRWKLVSSNKELDPLTSEQRIIELPTELAIDKMLADAATALADKYAVSETSDSKIGHRLLVSAIDGFKRFIDVQSYLSDLPPVKNMKLEKVYSDQLEFSVELYEGLDKLQQYIELGGRLSLLPVETSSDSIASDDFIHYIWNDKN